MNKPCSKPQTTDRAEPACGSARDRSVWTLERVARALRLYLEEDFTAAEVADALGADISRAAVTAKIRRLGFLKRQSRAAGRRLNGVERVRQPRVERRLPPQRPPQPLPPLRELGAAGVPTRLAALPAQACRWPIDDPGAGRMHLALFCAAPATRGVYCEAHWTLAHDRSPAQPEPGPEPGPASPAPLSRPQPQTDSAPLARAA